MADEAPTERWLAESIRLACASVEDGGGPFGALVVRDGQVLGRGSNRVVLDRDPTAHAEVLAIREACKAVGSHDLAGAELFASCEPCPMCLAAAHWARIDRVHHAATRAEAAAAGFDDALLYDELARAVGDRRLPMVRALETEGGAPFAAWSAKADRTPY